MNFSIGDFLIQYIVLLLSLTIHESAHAWMADKMGDPTAKMLGRISLNPIVHIDIIGTVILPILAAVTGWALIGWAKPVPVNPMNLKNPRKDDMLISALGPVSNVALAVIFAIIFNIVRFVLPREGLFNPVYRFLVFGILINIILALFNLIPIPPLDGSGVLMGFLSPSAAEKYEKIRPFGIIIIYILMYSGLFGFIIFPLSWFIFNILT
jgi:Zn-dependent protease